MVWVIVLLVLFLVIRNFEEISEFFTTIILTIVVFGGLLWLFMGV